MAEGDRLLQILCLETVRSKGRQNVCFDERDWFGS